jgi:hypothetical protein
MKWQKSIFSDNSGHWFVLDRDVAGMTATIEPTPGSGLSLWLIGNDVTEQLAWFGPGLSDEAVRQCASIILCCLADDRADALKKFSDEVLDTELPKGGWRG